MDAGDHSAVRELIASGMIVHVVDIRDRRARGRVDAYRISWMMMGKH